MEVLTYYGGGQLKCSWVNCDVRDMDMLSIDHIDNNGAAHRREHGEYGKAAKLYSWLKKHGFPIGYQTLCANHQMKKEILRKREICRQLDEQAKVKIQCQQN